MLDFNNEFFKWIFDGDYFKNPKNFEPQNYSKNP